MSYAGVGRRAAAYLIDGVVAVGLLSLGLALVVGAVLGVVQAMSGTAIGEETTRAAAVWITVLGPLLSGVYFLLFEGATGATPGKRLFGLRVVKADGSPCGWGAALVRTLLRLLDGFGFYLVGALFIWTTGRRQRLGDLVARTYVVRDAPAPAPRLA